MHKYSNLKTRISKWKEQVKKQTKNERAKIIKLKPKGNNDLSPLEVQHIKKQKAVREQEAQLKATMAELVRTMGKLFVI